MELGSTGLWLFTLLVVVDNHRGVPVLFFSHWPAGSLC